MITKEQIHNQINNLVTVRNLSSLSYGKNEILKQIERASSLDCVMKSSLRNLLNKKVSTIEMNFIRNFTSQINSFTSRIENSLRYIHSCDWITLRSLENEVKGLNSNLSCIETELRNVPFSSAVNLLNLISQKKNSLIRLIEEKKASFRRDEELEEERREAIERLERKRREMERKRKEEEKRKKMLANQQKSNQKFQINIP